jgi:hypothetical protein
MLLRAKSDKANLILTEGEYAQMELLFDCSAIDDRCVLEIGNVYPFTSKTRFHLLGKRQPCGLRIRVKRRSSAGPKVVEKLALSTSKIGELGFYPSSEKDDFYAARAASLEAMVFVSDQIFENLLANFRAAMLPSSIELEIEKDGVLEYGWEPDGSRQVWKLEKTNDPSYVNVESFEVATDLKG